MSAPDQTAPPAPVAAPTHAPDITDDVTVAGSVAQPQSPPTPPTEAPVPSGPYRTFEIIPVLGPALPPPKRPRPVIGPTLTTFAALLWSFVVAGQFTTSWLVGAPLPQGMAFFVVTLTTFAAWLSSVRLSGVVTPPRGRVWFLGRAVTIAFFASILFFGSVMAATIAGETVLRNHDLAIAFLLVVVATGAAILGPRWTSPAPLERTHGQRVRLVMLWIAGGLVTLVAGVDLAANG